MSKNAYFFPHDCNARNDARLVAVRMRHGAEGYGAYFMILERLGESTDYMSVADYNIIAFDLRVSAALVKSIVEDFGLFSITEDGRFYSDSFLKRMQPLDNLREQRRLAGLRSAAKRASVERPLTKTATTVGVKSNKGDIGEDKKEKDNKDKGISDEIPMSNSPADYPTPISEKRLSNNADPDPVKGPKPQAAPPPGSAAPPSKRFIPPTFDEVKAYCQERGNNIDPQHFIDYYESNGWIVGKVKMKSWRAAVRNWEKNNFSNGNNYRTVSKTAIPTSTDGYKSTI